MIVVCYIMGVSMIGIHYTDNVFMGMTVFVNLVAMVDGDLCYFSDIMSRHTGVGRQNHTDRQSNGQRNS